MKNKINTIASSLHKNHVKAVLYKKYGSNPQQLKRQIRTFGFSGMFLLCVFIQKKAINKILHKSFRSISTHARFCVPATNIQLYGSGWQSQYVQTIEKKVHLEFWPTTSTLDSSTFFFIQLGEEIKSPIFTQFLPLKRSTGLGRKENNWN